MNKLSRWNPFKFFRNRSRKPTSAVAGDTTAGNEGPRGDALARPVDPFGALLPSSWFGDFSLPVFMPKTDVVDAGDALVVTLEVPGMSKEDLGLSVEDGALVIKGEKRHETESEEKGCYRIERSYGFFQRAIPLPEDVKLDAIEATMDKGVLSVRIPKDTSANKRGRTIAIQ